MSVDVVVSYRILKPNTMTPYVELSRSTWRWKWLAYLLNPVWLKLARNNDGDRIFIKFSIEPTPPPKPNLTLIQGGSQSQSRD